MQLNNFTTKNSVSILRIFHSKVDVINGLPTVNAGITVTTYGETVDQGICAVLEETQDFIAGVQPGDIDGVEDTVYLRHEVGGDVMCAPPAGTVLSPIISDIIMQEPKKSLLNSVLWPLLAAVIVVALLVARRLRNGKKEDPDEWIDEDIKPRGLFGIDGYDQNMHYRGEGDPDHLNALDVHKCTSQQCKICAMSVAPAFLPVGRNDSRLLNDIKQARSNDVATGREDGDEIFKFEDANSTTMESVSLT